MWILKSGHLFRLRTRLADGACVVVSMLIGVSAGTYLMAVRDDTASWVSYGLAGAVTAAMPAVEFLHVRQLRRLLATH